MPAGCYKRTAYHKKRQEDGWANSKYKFTDLHKKRISKSVSAWWKKERKERLCPTCGQRIKHKSNKE